jgi:hypothetical protein
MQYNRDLMGRPTLQATPTEIREIATEFKRAVQDYRQLRGCTTEGWCKCGAGHRGERAIVTRDRDGSILMKVYGIESGQRTGHLRRVRIIQPRHIFERRISPLVLRGA